jgi:hypothetical protein
MSCGGDGKNDGICGGDEGTTFSGVTSTPASIAVEKWLRAFETAGANGGGAPDSSLVQQAQAVPLSKFQHEAIRRFVIGVQIAYLGYDVYADPNVPHLLGSYSAPAADPNSMIALSFQYYPTGQNGTVHALNACTLAVGQVVRSSIVRAVQTEDLSVMDNLATSITAACGTYATFGRCEYPHPASHGHAFPYCDGATCLASELKLSVMDTFFHSGEEIPALTPFGVLLLTLSFLTVGAILLLRRGRTIA